MYRKGIYTTETTNTGKSDVSRSAEVYRQTHQTHGQANSAGPRMK